MANSNFKVEPFEKAPIRPIRIGEGKSKKQILNRFEEAEEMSEKKVETREKQQKIQTKELMQVKKQEGMRNKMGRIEEEMEKKPIKRKIKEQVFCVS